MAFEVNLKNVSKVFGSGDISVKAISDISVSIPKHTFFVIAGPSGAGKTTLFNLIGGLDRPTSGEIIVGDFNLNKMNEKKLALFRRKHLGFIFQGNNLIPTLTVFENIELPLLLNGIKNKKSKIFDMLKTVGLGPRKDTFPQYLSGGEQQRVAIARAVVHSPSIILADEPTGNLDSKTSEDILFLLEKLNKQFKATVLFSTHDTTIINKCKNVLNLTDGTLQS